MKSSLKMPAFIGWIQKPQCLDRSALKQDSSIDGSIKSSGHSSSKKEKSLRRLISSKSTARLSDKESTDHAEDDELVYPSAIMTDDNIKVPCGLLCAVVGPGKSFSV